MSTLFNIFYNYQQVFDTVVQLEEAVAKQPETIKRFFEIFENQHHCYFGAVLLAELEWSKTTSVFGGETEEEKELIGKMLKLHHDQFCSNHLLSKEETEDIEKFLEDTPAKFGKMADTVKAPA